MLSWLRVWYCRGIGLVLLSFLFFFSWVGLPKSLILSGSCLGHVLVLSGLILDFDLGLGLCALV